MTRLIQNSPAVAPEASPRRHPKVSPWQTGDAIRFRLGDAYAPSLNDLFKQMTPEVELEGNITLLSTGPDHQAAYALVEVPGVMVPIIVPASCVEIIADKTPVAATA